MNLGFLPLAHIAYTFTYLMLCLPDCARLKTVKIRETTIDLFDVTLQSRKLMQSSSRASRSHFAARTSPAHIDDAAGAELAGG